MGKYAWLEHYGFHELKPQGTMRKWCEAHDGQIVHLTQVLAREDGVPVSAWMPGGRKLVAGKTYASFDGSIREYSPGRVLHAEDDALIVAHPWGEREHVCIYQLDSRAGS